jgi:hypothetical protein
MHRRPIDLKLVNASPQVAGAIDRGSAVAEDKQDAKNQNKKPDEKGRGHPAPPAKAPKPAQAQTGPKEIGGRKGPDPTRYGDWEKKGRCIDF